MLSDIKSLCEYLCVRLAAIFQTFTNHLDPSVLVLMGPNQSLTSLINSFPNFDTQANARQNLQYNWVTSKDSGQPAHPHSMARVLVYSSLDSPGAVESTCDQRRLWLGCVDAQSVQSQCWSHVFFRFCHALTKMRKYCFSDNGFWSSK